MFRGFGVFVSAVTCFYLLSGAAAKGAAGADQAPAAEKVEHASSGWVIEVPKGWRKPKPYDDPSVEQHWDAQGYAHRVPPGADPEVFIGPMLIWWGEPLPENQTPEEVVKVLAGHHGFAEKLKRGEWSDLKIGDKPARKVEASFRRSIAFAPPGKGHGDMRAVLYLVRADGQENGIWFEAPAAEFERHLKDVESIVASARIRPRKPRDQ